MISKTVAPAPALEVRTTAIAEPVTVPAPEAKEVVREKIPLNHQEFLTLAEILRKRNAVSSIEIGDITWNMDSSIVASREKWSEQKVITIKDGKYTVNENLEFALVTPEGKEIIIDANLLTILSFYLSRKINGAEEWELHKRTPEGLSAESVAFWEANKSVFKVDKIPQIVRGTEPERKKYLVPEMGTKTLVINPEVKFFAREKAKQ